jgi:hypothetical protein
MSKEKKILDFMVVSGTYSADLKGRQSVRTTFKLSPRSIDALSLLAAQLGIKQKSLFDHLIDDTQTLKAIARDVESPEMRANRVPKTYVISRRTLESLDEISRHYQTPRDILVEFSIERIMPLIKEERKKHENRKKLMNSVDGLLENSRSLLQEADKMLDRDDPVLEKVFQICRTINQGCAEINTIVEKGQKLEEF